MLIRSGLHRLGFRFRLHDRKLPGRPDLVLPGRKAVVLVHGCFWHGHDCRRGARPPKANADYWSGKIERNRARDLRTAQALAAMGWRQEIVWECELKDEAALEARLAETLTQPR